MAPKKQTTNGEKLATRGRSVATAAGRVTRSQSSAGKGKLRAPILASPKPKKAKTAAGKKEAKPKEELQTEASKDQVEESSPEKSEVEENGEEEAQEQDADATDGKKTIVVEYCKQCRSFKVRADQVKAGLEKAVPGIIVELNPGKPRKGCFEIREEGGEVFISLENMKRPFKPMKDLDMEEVVAGIVAKIK